MGARILDKGNYGCVLNRKRNPLPIRSTKVALKRMYDAGILIVMGSDDGCWPVIPYIFHGVGSIRELEVMVEAGVPANEVIPAATINAARMIGVENHTGLLAVGKSADLVIYDEDPMINVKSFRRPAYVMKSRVLRTECL